MAELDAESADEWQDVVSQCFIPLNCVAFQSGFHGHMDHLSLDAALSISTVTTDGTTVERSERQARLSESDDIHLSMQVSSRGSVRQGMRMVGVRPGSITMYATDQPYYQDYSEPGQRQLIVQLSRAALDVTGPVLAGGLDRLSVRPSVASRTFFSYVATLQKKAWPPSPQLPASFAEVALDLASTMIRSSSSTTRIIPRTTGGLLRSVEDFVVSNISQVRVDDIASEFFVSRRTVYTLFEQLETTPSEYLRRKRLTAASARLDDRSQDGITIRTIAAESGFGDLTTFERAFRREFGMTPREWRRARPDT